MNSSASGIPLPSGFRFIPSEHQLIEYYLIPKLTSSMLHLDAVMDLDLYKFDPDQLPLNHYERTKPDEAYFFTESIEGDNSTRATPSGFWKTYKENIAVFQGNTIIGFKNKLVFCNGTYPNGDETNWKIVEYRCNPSIFPANSNNKNWVVCKVYRKINLEEEEAYEDLEEEEVYEDDEEETYEDDD